MSIETQAKNLVKTIQQHEEVKDFIFLSLGKRNIKAIVKLLKNPKRLERDIIKQCQNFKKKTGEYPEWIKVDIVTDVVETTFNDIHQQLVETRRNYVDFGIAFDQFWNLTFLPEEINANAFVIPDRDTNQLYLSERNINNYLRKYTNHSKAFSIDFYQNNKAYQFYTKGYILDQEQIYELDSKGVTKGLRQVDNLSQEIDKMITSSVDVLEHMGQENGRFIYGYFGHFDKEINFYNILRHSSSTYALVEGLTYLHKDLAQVEKAIDYIIDNYLYVTGDTGYIFDDAEGINEIKLGQNASFIFAVCEYLKVKPDNNKYLGAAQKVAHGILTMINPVSSKTTHVLNYPDLTIKEDFRIVYYDGEAALALLRLYQIDQNSLWLDTTKKLFSYFIEHDYWKFHDHWLGYCTNELVQIEPKDEYFIFGIKNVNTYLDFIKTRELTYPTFFEMLMASYRLVQKAKETGRQQLVDDLIDERQLIDIIQLRANYQRVGYYYPEVAMYFKNPARLLGGFFMKHHAYRMRIDDLEHYISGYVQYQKVFKE